MEELFLSNDFEPHHEYDNIKVKMKREFLLQCLQLE